VLFLVVSLMLIFVRVGHVGVMLNCSRIVLMMILVVASIFTFVSYYIVDDVSNENFKLLKILFLILMIVALTGYGVVIFIG